MWGWPHSPLDSISKSVHAFSQNLFKQWIQVARGGTRHSLWNVYLGVYLLMESTGPLGSQPLSVLDVPFPFDDGTLLGLSNFISGMVRTWLRLVSHLKPQGHVRCLSGETFHLHQNPRAVRSCHSKGVYWAAVSGSLHVQNPRGWCTSVWFSAAIGTSQHAWG